MNGTLLEAADGAVADGDAPFEAWMDSRCARVEQALRACLPAATTAPGRLHEAMAYATLGGGKRVRPLLAYGAGELVGAPRAAVDAVACAVELIHAYSLVHDDLPCMDDDVLRRGRPTVHVAYGEATAMLVGDALQALAFQALAGAARSIDDPARIGTMVERLAHAAGSLGMAGGQAIDLESVGAMLTRPELERMHRMKTGAMLRASVMLGVLCGPPSSPAGLESLERYAASIGLAFQVVDDVLDVASDTATLGKTAGKDSEQNKPTYVSVLGLEGARRHAAELLGTAHAALEGFGPAARRLRELADLIVARTT